MSESDNKSADEVSGEVSGAEQPEEALFDIDSIGVEEVAAARSLAHALERGSGDDAPAEALQTAALLAFSRSAGEIEPARLDEILEDVLREAKVARPEKAAGRWLRWLIPAGLFATAAAAILLVLSTQGPAGPAALPTPTASLLQAQTTAASGDGSELQAEMQQYRAQVLSTLSTHYGGR